MSKELVKRTWHYAYHPNHYEIRCPKCEETKNITWSEFKEHLWCYKCEEDILIEGSIFNGPVPIQVSHMLGFRFDIIIIETGEKKIFNIKTGKYDL